MRKQTFVIGLIVIIGLAILVFVSFYMNRIRISLDSAYVYVKFENADGLKVKDEIRVRGIKCGFVSKIELTDDFVCARLTVSKKIHIPDNSIVGIHDLAVIGGSKYLMLYPGDGPVYRFPEDTLYGTNYDFNFAKIAIIMDDLKTAVENVIPDKDALAELLDSIQSGIDNVNQLIVNTDRAMIEVTGNVDKTVNSIGTATDTLATVISGIKESIDEYRNNENTLKNILTSDSLSMKLDRNLMLLEEVLEQLKRNRMVKGCL